MLDDAPGELLLLDEGRQFGLVREEDGQVGRQNAVLNEAQYLLVLIVGELAENVVSVLEKEVD